MSAGTLTLTNNSAAVAGNGTAFTTEVAAGDFIVVTVGGVPYTLPVKSVESGTALTLVSNFTGPTQAGAAWSAVPRVALNMVTAAMVVQNTEALRGLNYDKQNWQQVFSGTGNVTVKLPDGSSFTGPAWGGIISKLNDKADTTSLDGYAKKGENSDITKLSGLTTPLSMEQGGLGAKDAAGGRIKLGLGSAATKDSGTGTGNLLEVGAFGMGGNAIAFNDSWHIEKSCFERFGGGEDGYPFGAGINIKYNDDYAFMLHVETNSANVISYVIHRGANGNERKVNILWGAANTTVDSNGFIKKASPVVKIFADGHFITNEESDGVSVLRCGTGEYLVKGCTGLHSDAAWGGIDGGFEIPVDRNKQPRVWLDYMVNADGSILVKTYHRVNGSAPSFAQNRIGSTDINGMFTETVADREPVDIPADSFVSVRVEMPADSIWNQKQKELQEAVEKDGYVRGDIPL